MDGSQTLDKVRHTLIIMEFYTTMELLSVNEVELYNCDVWYQQFIPFLSTTNDDDDDEE